MTDTPDMFECRLVGYSKQSRKDGDWVEIRLHIHPDDVTPALAQAPLKTVFMVAAVPADRKATLAQMGATTEKPKRSWDEIPLSEQAGIRIHSENFRHWLANHWGYEPFNGPIGCDLVLKEHLHILSKADIKHDTDAGNAWCALDQEYQDSCGLIAERTT